MEIVFGLVSAICFGVADFLARFATRRVGVYRTLFFMQCVGLLGVTLFLIASGGLARLGTTMQWQPWVWGLLTAVVYAGSYVALYRAFSIGQLAVVAPIASGYGAVTTILSLFSGEHLQPVQGIGIIAVLVGMVLAAQHKAEPVEKPQEKEPQQRGLLPPGVLWAILAAFGLGVTFWLLGFTVAPALGDALPIWLFRLVTACLMVPLALGSRFGESESGLVPPRGDVLGLVAGIGLLDTGAFIASTLGFATGQVAIVSVLSSLYSAVAVMLAWIFLKEPLRAIQWAGILLLLIGIVLTHL